MKSLAIAAMAAVLAAGVIASESGTTGVRSDTCWTNSSGNEIEVDIVGTIHGDQKVTVTEGDESGTGTGTPADDDGCLESSDIAVGDELYRAENGGMQWENPTGDWIDMTEVDCDDEEPGTIDAEETIGSLPHDVVKLILLREDEVFVSLPA